MNRRLAGSILLLASAQLHGATAELPLVDYVAGLRTVHARLGDRPLQLLFDTAGGGTVLSPAATSGYCVPFGEVVGMRHSGELMRLPRCGEIDLRIGSFSSRGEVAVFDPMALLGEAPKVDGILGLAAFARQPLVLDNEHQRLLLMSRAELMRWVRREHLQELEIRLSRQAGGAALDVFVAAAAPPGPLWLELDSGNTGPVLLAAHAFVQLGLDAATPPGAMSLTVQGLPAMDVDVSRRELVYDGLLNATFVRAHVWAFDLEQGRAWARPVKAAD